MRALVRKVFGVYPGEGLQALRFARLVTFWAFGSSCLDTLSDGLFLEKIGANFFPQTYFCTSLIMIAVSALVLYGLRIAHPYRILMLILSFGACVCITAALMMEGSPPTWFWYGFKIASKMFFIMIIPLSWTFTDQYHDLQDAKRVYAIYNAAYSIGTICSGLTINFFLETLGFSTILMGASLCIGLAMLEANLISKKIVAIQDDSTEGVFSASKGSFLSTLKLLVRSRFVVVLLLMGLFNQLMNTVTEFNYMETFGDTFKANPIEEGHIAEFLGKCRACISFANILIGMFVYSRVLRRIGLGNTILITPLIFLAVYSGWIFQDSLTFAVLGLISIEGFLYTFDDNGFNLMSNAVPSKIKSKVRILYGSFFEPIGMLLSSFLLFSFQKESLGLGLILAFCVLLLAFILKAVYPGALLNNLKENAIHFERKLKDWMHSIGRREHKESIQCMLKAIRSSDVEMQIMGAKALLEIGSPSLLKETLLSAKKFGTSGKIKLLHLLESSPYYQHADVINTISAWVDENDSPELLRHANFYLAKRGMHLPEKVEDDLDETDLLMRGAAILTFKKSLAETSISHTSLNRTIANKKLELMLKSENIDEVVMGLDILSQDGTAESAERAIPFLSHDSKFVARAAAKTIALLADKSLARHAPLFIEEIERAFDHPLRISLLTIFGKIANSTTIRDLLTASVHFRPSERRYTEEIIVQMGLKTVPLLLTLTMDAGLPVRARILAGKILGRLALPQLRANLPEILDTEIDRAYFYFYFAHTIQKQYPLFDLKMLQSALLSGYQSVIDFIIHLLGAAGSLEDPELLVRSLHSQNEKIHSHAVESLEKTCDARIFRLIMPLIDDLPFEEKMAACLRWQEDAPQLTLSELLDQLDDSPLLFDKIVAVRLKNKLQMPNWREELRELMKHSDENFHQYAYELLQT